MSFRGKDGEEHNLSDSIIDSIKLYDIFCFEVTRIKSPITDTRTIETKPKKVKMLSMPKEVSIAFIAFTESAPTPKVKMNFKP